MNYFFLVAGRGTRMQPLTLNYPKTLFKLDKDTTILSRMVQMIKDHDPDGRIIVVTGFKKEMIEAEVDGVIFVNNPFYADTNSIASLWFAREYLSGDCVIFDGDVLLEESLMTDVVCVPVKRPEVLVDSSVKSDGDYNVEVIDDKVVVMSKGLKRYFGEYVGVSRVDAASAELLRTEMDMMVEDGQYDQWYENALVQMIFERDFSLYYRDICDYEWTEVDEADDLLFARHIFKNDQLSRGA